MHGKIRRKQGKLKAQRGGRERERDREAAVRLGDVFGAQKKKSVMMMMEEDGHEAMTGGAAAADNMTATSTPLSAVAEAFEGLEKVLRSSDDGLPLVPFNDACGLVSLLFECLGLAFKFAESEYVSKVNDLVAASKNYGTLNDIIDHDVQNDSVRKPGSHSRNLRRIRLGLDLIKVLFDQVLSASGCTLQEAASVAYEQVCAPYHTWAIRKAVSVGMYTLPTKDQLLLKLNESDETMKKEMQRYIDASTPIIDHIDNIFLSRNISLDW